MKQNEIKDIQAKHTKRSPESVSCYINPEWLNRGDLCHGGNKEGEMAILRED